MHLADCRRRALSLAVALAAGLAACASVDYTPPPPAEPPPLEVGIDAPFAEVWSRLEGYLEERQGKLTVRSMNRDLGEVVIAFGPAPPATYADCGQITRTNPDFSGPFAEFLWKHARGTLRGEVTVRAHRSETLPTRVTVGVRYVLTATTEDQDYSMAFNSTTPARHRTGRSCRSNYGLESDVIRVLQGF